MCGMNTRAPDNEISIPMVGRFDSAIALLREGYEFIGNRCRELRSDIFATRLAGRKAICMLGPEAAAFFYDGDRFTRNGAMPPTTLRLLQDIGSVQSIDGPAHRHRKSLFLDLLSPSGVTRLGNAFDEAWTSQFPAWRENDDIVLTTAIRDVLTRAACAWAGVPIADHEIAERSREFGAMIDGAGAFGPALWKGLYLRRRTEQWCTDLVERVRDGRLDVPMESVLAQLAMHRDLEGQLLPAGIAAVELINLLRPIVAISNYITFAALALHDYPDTRPWLADDPANRTEPFVHELRRYYPFFPFIAGIARDAHMWKGHAIPAGSWVILDLYGTNHDPRTWENPEEFVFGRFVGWQRSPYTLVPQGAGDYHDGHRCPGEQSTIEIMKRATNQLLAIAYRVPPQDLRVRLTDFPAQPRSRFVMTGFRA
jgi:fatty-acid peroxygenase